jgi:hypothetical protein
MASLTLLDSDVITRVSRGTHAYWRNNSEVYLSLHEICLKRWMRGFDKSLMGLYAPQHPSRYRLIEGNTVGRELINRPLLA